MTAILRKKTEFHFWLTGKDNHGDFGFTTQKDINRDIRSWMRNKNIKEILIRRIETEKKVKK